MIWSVIIVYFERRARFVTYYLNLSINSPRDWFVSAFESSRSLSRRGVNTIWRKRRKNLTCVVVVLKNKKRRKTCLVVNTAPWTPRDDQSPLFEGLLWEAFFRFLSSSSLGLLRRRLLLSSSFFTKEQSYFLRSFLSPFREKSIRTFIFIFLCKKRRTTRALHAHINTQRRQRIREQRAPLSPPARVIYIF